MKTVLFLSIAWTFLSVAACTGQEEPEMMQPESTTDRMRFDVRYPEVGTVPSRVTDNHFDSGDSIGLYVAVSGQPLEPAGNEVNNAPLTWKGTSGWQAPQPIYWNGGTYDVFAYYPYTSSVTSVDDYPLKLSWTRTVLPPMCVRADTRQVISSLPQPVVRRPEQKP